MHNKTILKKKSTSLTYKIEICINRTIYLMLYAFFLVIPQCLNFICQRFGTLCLSHLHRRIGMKDDWVWESLVCSSPLCFSNTLGSFVGCSQYTASLFIYVYILLYVTWTTCFDLSIYQVIIRSLDYLFSSLAMPVCDMANFT